MARVSRYRYSFLALLCAAVAASCAGSDDATDAPTTTVTPTASTAATSAGGEALEAAEARIAELEAELFAATSTTTTTVPRDMVVWSHEAGEYIAEPFVDNVWGWVSDPQAEVDVNNSSLVVEESNVFGPPEGQNWSLPLNEGRNMLMVTATFPDGSTIVDDIVVFHDPALTKELGKLARYESDEPRTLTFGIGYEDQQPAGGGINVESTATYRVADDAVFKVEAADTSDWRVLQVDHFYELLDFVESGGCTLCIEDGCCPDRCIWAAWDTWEGLEFAIYLNSDGDIQQLTQLHLHN